MDLRSLVVIATCLTGAALHAQVPWIIEWQHAIGSSLTDIGEAVHGTSDGGYIIGGYSGGADGDLIAPHGGKDIRVIKLDALGAIEWQATLGGMLDEQCEEVRQTADGGYLAMGSTHSDDGDVTGFHGVQDAWVVKLDGTGAVEWQRALGGSLEDQGFALDLTPDGGCLVAGETMSNDGDVTGAMGSHDAWVVKLAADGSIDWQRALGGSDEDLAFSVRSTADGGAVLTGETSSNDGDVTGNHGLRDIWVVKLDDAGGIQWQRSLGGSNSEVGWCVRQTSEGGYVVAGYTYSNDGDVSSYQGNRDYWVIGLTADGELDWERSLGGSLEDTGNGVIQTSDGGYLISGNTTSNDGDVSGNHGELNDVWLVKLDGSATIQWQRCLGGTATDVARMFSLTSDGGGIVIGNTQSNDGDVSGNNGASDIWVVKLREETTTAMPTDMDMEPGMSVMSGPEHDHVTIICSGIPSGAVLTLTEASGRAIARHVLTGPSSVLDLRHLSPGSYVVTVIGDQGPLSRYFVR